MEDRFKFRIFNKKDNEMIEDDYNLFLLNKDGDVLFNTIIDGYKIIPNFNNDYILMQCTGLKDKHSKLIYESDFVRIERENWGKTVTEIIKVQYTEFADCGCCGNVEGVGFNFGGPYRENWMEVIGNLYENPDLLKENNK